MWMGFLIGLGGIRGVPWFVQQNFCVLVEAELLVEVAMLPIILV